MTYAINATGPFYHGTRAELKVGDLLSPGLACNSGDSGDTPISGTEYLIPHLQYLQHLREPQFRAMPGHST